MADRDDYGEQEPPPLWLDGILGWAAEARSWAVTGVLVWLAVLGVLAVVAVIGLFFRAVASIT